MAPVERTQVYTPKGFPNIVYVGGDYFYVVKATTGRRDSPPSVQAHTDNPVGCLF